MCYFDSSIDVFATALTNDPGGFLVSVEVASGNKYIRRIVLVTGAVLTFNESIPETVAADDVLRFLDAVYIMGNAPKGVPDPPTKPVKPIEFDAL